MAAVAVAVLGLLEGAEHERCIRPPAVPAPRGLAGDQAARLGGDLARLAAREIPGRSGGVGTPRSCELARPAARPAAGRAGRGRGRSPAPACARAAARPARWRGSSAARSAGGTRSAATARAATTSPAESKSNSGSEDSTSSAGRRRGARRARRPRPRAIASGSATSSGGRLAAGEDRVELVVVEARVGADPAAVEARRARPRRRRSSSISAVTASRSTPGARLQASSLSACGSIGSTVPGA